MCGIAGFYDNSGRYANSAMSIATEMSSTIKHRGPDDHGIWIGEKNRLAMVHQRLSIIDISSAGHQPMSSSTDRYIVIFNGEIYNHQEIRGLLNEVSWKGESDTETLIEAIEQWGLSETLKKCSGMFAFSLWDRQLKRLSLVRDRMGEKPLYYGWCNDVFVFGSELKSLKAHPAFENKINMDAVTLYFNHGYIPAPFSIYEGVNKLTPGSILHLTLKSPHFKSPKIERYWSLNEVTSKTKIYQTGQNKIYNHSSELEKRLTRAIMQQSVSDVPLGSFLSGGIDSSLITAILQKNSDRKIQTFSLGFNEEKYNEAKYAKLIANHIGTDHHELIVNPSDLQDVIPKLSKMYDEPFGDPSAIPTFIVSQFAHNDVKVSLTGDGGDELFGGYNHYHRSAQIWSAIRKVPYSIRNMSASILNPVGSRMYNTALGRRAERLTNYLMCQSLFDCYKVQTQASKIELSSILFNPENVSYPDISGKLEGYEAMMFADAITYLPDDILVKVDRAAMATSLETRAPFLDHHVVEFAFGLPLEYKINNGSGKLILRELLSKHVPKKLFERPKMGFGIPIDDWLRGSLRDWAEDLLSEKSLKDIGFFNSKIIRSRWAQHIREECDWHYFIWDLLMFIEWYRREGK
jgi:asparagine synthase (glutamine-hydrolysing)